MLKLFFLPKCLIVCFQIYTFQQIAAHISDFHGKIQRNEGRLKACLLTYCRYTKTCPNVFQSSMCQN